MQPASMPCADRGNSLSLLPWQSLWRAMLRVSAVHVRIAYAAPWQRID
ncbi:hypothetical protein [Novosphingobium sp. KACC 22771]|nr:hypothetical protein [Novosphingobium sp. KACC 22771]WDF74463.1 hypothetical protein PQ467_21215 [Novosphingobium sp. KACC 22771]